MNADDLEAGQLFGRYQIVRLLGRGGMGTVYEAVHVTLKKRFAIKTLLTSLASSVDARARFLREGEVASRINHPNVVTVSDVGVENETPYLVMEFLEGETLGQFLVGRGRLEVSKAVDLLLPIVSAVAAGHDQGVVHRDLKPQNIFLARSHRGEVLPKVLDFGVSKLLGEGDSSVLTRTMTVLGTAAYMAPEQARGARIVDGRSDQYALGLILYEMLTGVRAHEGGNTLEVLHNVAAGSISPVLSHRPELPRALSDCLHRMLALSPKDRYPALRAAGLALRPFASDTVRQATSGTFEEPAAATDLPRADAPDRRLPRTILLPETARRPGDINVGGTQLFPGQGPSGETAPGKVVSQLGADPTASRPEPSRRARRRLVAATAATAAVGIAVLVGLPARPARLHHPPDRLSGRSGLGVEDLRPQAAKHSGGAKSIDTPLQPPRPPGPAGPVTEGTAEADRSGASPAADAVPETALHRTPHPQKRACRPNFVVDDKGDKHFKPECFIHLK
jgi:tRNA A-37 threonylcarbamoyl transferase component Bud32